MLPFGIKQVRIYSQLLLFDEEHPVTFAITRARLPYLTRSYSNTSNYGLMIASRKTTDVNH